MDRKNQQVTYTYQLNRLAQKSILHRGDGKHRHLAEKVSLFRRPGLQPRRKAPSLNGL